MVKRLTPAEEVTRRFEMSVMKLYETETGLRLAKMGSGSQCTLSMTNVGQRIWDTRA